MDPSSSQQQPPPIKHLMTIPEKIELTSTGAYPSPQSSSQRQDTHAYRAMRVPDKIMLESTGEGEEERREGEGGRQVVGVSGGVGGYFQQAQPFSSEPPLAAQGSSSNKRRPAGALEVEQVMLRNLSNRVQSLEQQMRTLNRVVLQQGDRGNPERRGYGVWYVLTFAGCLMVPLVVVFMFHYRKTSH